MESSDEETDSGVLKKAYSFTDMLDELDTEETSESLASEGVTSPTGPLSPLPKDQGTRPTSKADEPSKESPEDITKGDVKTCTEENKKEANRVDGEKEQIVVGNTGDPGEKTQSPDNIDKMPGSEVECGLGDKKTEFVDSSLPTEVQGCDIDSETVKLTQHEKPDQIPKGKKCIELTEGLDECDKLAEDKKGPTVENTQQCDTNLNQGESEKLDMESNAERIKVPDENQKENGENSKILDESLAEVPDTKDSKKDETATKEVEPEGPASQLEVECSTKTNNPIEVNGLDHGVPSSLDDKKDSSENKDKPENIAENKESCPNHETTISLDDKKDSTESKETSENDAENKENSQDLEAVRSLDDNKDLRKSKEKSENDAENKENGQDHEAVRSLDDNKDLRKSKEKSENDAENKENSPDHEADGKPSLDGNKDLRESKEKSENDAENKENSPDHEVTSKPSLDGNKDLSDSKEKSENDAINKSLQEKSADEQEEYESKKDPIWKRKKVIKKRRKKGSIDSQSSTSFESEESLSNSSSFDGESFRLLKKDSPSPEVGGPASGDNPTYVSEVAGASPHLPTDDSLKDDGYEPIEFRPLVNNNTTKKGYDDEDIYVNVPNSDLFKSVAGKNDPKRSTLRRGSTLRSVGASETCDMTYKDRQKLVKVLPDEHPQNHSSSEVEVRPGSTLSKLDQEGIYESIAFPAPLSPLTPSRPYQDYDDEDYDNYSWGSSEFESYDEDEYEERQAVGEQEPISVTVHVKSHQESSNQTVLNKLAARIGPRSRSRDEQEESNVYLEVTLNMEKHPPPELPPPPDNLTPAQMKRRLIVASIVESERSYTNSLRRIIEEYQKPLMLAKPQIISKNSIKAIFYRISDILQCHNMFHIELTEYIRVWDTEEKIGNVFTASFSKSMVFDVYSEFVNNFTIAMEAAKKQTKQKQAFADFLKMKIQTSTDKLSLFGLMVKPIQRFPQFILCLQDLLKHTSHDHHDRLALQLALTELETLTHKLNEMKRESENRHEVKRIMSSMTGRFSLKHDNERCMVRQDDMLQLDCTTNSSKNKPRRLFMISDQLVCATVIQKDGETGLAEKFKFKWSIPIRDVEVVEVEVPDLYQVKGGPGRSMIVAPKLDQSTFSPWKKEMDDMMHDLAIIEQISNLTSQLRLDYQMLTPDTIFSIQRGLQLAIQDQGDVDQCILHLSLPTKATRMIHTFHVQSASIKQDWLLELKNAKLALAPNNKPGWYVPETDQAMCVRLPLFVKPLLLDITKQETRIKCAIPVMFPSPTNPFIGVQHLWVCSNETNHGQVTVVSLHSSQPHVVESFSACDAPIVCAEFVPGFAALDHEHAFLHDTVWMAMEGNELCVRKVVEENRDAEPLLVMDTDDAVTCLRFMDEHLYVGLERGQLAIYSRNRDGVWLIEDRLLLDIGNGPIRSLLPLNHEMWVACCNKVHIINVTTRWRGGFVQPEVQQSEHEVGVEEEVVECMVKAGVGLMVSFRGHGVIRIFNQETFHHLQDINIASSVAQILDGKDLGEQTINPKKVSITAMLASKGLLWVGTCCGCTLTLPLPRLEGVPQIKGRPSVSYHSHLGPIKFISPIHCGMSQLQMPSSAPPSAAPSQIFHLDRDSDGGSGSEGCSEGGVSERRTPSLMIDGATESDTNCDDMEEGIVHDETMEDPRTDFLNQLVQNGARSQYLSTSMLNINQQGTLGKTKWVSTPDLRHGSAVNLTDSEEDVRNLYNNLLSSTDYELYDFELMGGKKRRRSSSEYAAPAAPAPVGETVRPQLQSQSSRTSRRSSKYATLPALMEDCPVYNLDSEPSQTETAGSECNDQSISTNSNTDRSNSSSSQRSSLYSPEISVTDPSEASTSHPRSPPAGPRRRIYTLGSTTHGNKNSSRSVVIVSGGEGHINWAEKNAGDTKYDDICLLLWQCRV